MASEAQALAKPGNPEASCWACRTRIFVPLMGETQLPAPVFKCGWCFALQETCVVPRPPSKNTPFKMAMKMLIFLNWAVVLLVSFFILTIILPGATVVLPFTCPNPIAFMLAHMVTFVFSFNVFFNFFAAMLHSPGTVKDVYSFPDIHSKEFAPVVKGMFDDFTRCQACDFYKPPWVRHCYTCRRCIVDKDHHCPFVHNCIGRSNVRNFLLFLIWTVSSVMYCMAQSAWMLYMQGSEFIAVVHLALEQTRTVIDVPFYSVTFYYVAPWSILVPTYIFWMSTGLLIMVGGLLWFQLRTGISPVFKKEEAHAKQRREDDSNNVDSKPHDCTTHPRSWSCMLMATKLALAWPDGEDGLVACLWPHWGPLPGWEDHPLAKKMN